ncbi:NAD(+) synthase [Borreliella bissettiae]|uniref:Glutamine-dependent NAD(+) synthetase n=2 Tax=Borrelia bissettiae TaxID=64897 RepID=G0ALW6_BORBD|nr:NAD(+) synthase [Borreliella bissettiae]AEL18692.1 NAD+ synthetase [Borreliella bissettiae DN127]WKC99936.1 NAD(+) synthase [Borreliella bissettiae]
MKISIAQAKYRALDFNKCIADFKANYDEALLRGSDVLVFPSMFLGKTNYGDLFVHSKYSQNICKFIEFMKEQVNDNTLIVFGHSVYKGGKFVDIVSVISNHKVILTASQGNSPGFFSYKDNLFAVLNFEDELLFEELIPKFGEDLKKAKYLIIPAKSYFCKEKNNLRLKFFERVAIENNLDIVYSNFYGVEDSAVYDGRSFFINSFGKIKQAKGFEFDFISNDTFQNLKFDTCNELFEKIILAISLVLREYISFSGFSKVHLGVSGGIDSALVACLACFALGAENVVGISMPSKFSSANSISDAKELSRKLGFKLIEMPIKDLFEVSSRFFEGYFDVKGVTGENLQARLRGLLLMSYSNSQNSLLLNTGNKSEIAVGYCTLYGDTCGGLALIGDLFKTEVYDFAKYINAKFDQCIIPVNIILKEPSAELRFDQKDSDSLPKYEVLDVILNRYLIDNESVDSIYLNFEKDIVDKVLNLYFKNEYKRRQGAPIVKVSKKTFGFELSMPILNNMI